MSVAVVGDTTLDVTVRADEPPRPGGDVPAGISIAPGGQGANVAVRLARAGVEVRLASAIADDPAGRLLLAALDSEGVEVARMTSTRSGTVVALLDAAGERTMLSDRVTLDPAAVVPACHAAAWVHCSGYPLADDLTGDAMAAALRSLPSSTRISAGGGSLPPDAARAARVRDRLTAARVGLLILGREEAAALLDLPLPSVAAAADALVGAFPATIAVVTGGAAGSAAAGPGFALSVVAQDPSTPMMDATGAGDAYAAALIKALLGATWPPDVSTLRAAMEAGSHAGGLVSRVLGAQGRISGERGGGR